MKKILTEKTVLTALTFILAATLLIGICGVTYAYLIVGSAASNVLTAGEDKGEIIEAFPTSEITNDNTGAVKEVRVQNTGNLPSFVRLRVVYASSDIEAATTLEYENTDLWIYDEKTDFYYYKDLVMPGEYTEMFISKVCTELEDGTEFDVTVYAELINHKDHDESCKAAEYIDIWS